MLTNLAYGGGGDSTYGDVRAVAEYTGTIYHLLSTTLEPTLTKASERDGLASAVVVGLPATGARVQPPTAGPLRRSQLIAP